MSISFGARQRFRQRMHNIEKADEILDALDNFINRFTIISGEFESNDWETIHEIFPEEGETLMVTFSIIGKETVLRQSGFKRTAVLYKNLGIVQNVELQQSDFTTRSDVGFNARIVADGGYIKLQVKGASNSTTQWKGSVEIESLGE